jgi:hypothetical protein
MRDQSKNAYFVESNKGHQQIKVFLVRSYSWLSRDLFLEVSLLTLFVVE